MKTEFLTEESDEQIRYANSGPFVGGLDLEHEIALLRNWTAGLSPLRPGGAAAAGPLRVVLRRIDSEGSSAEYTSTWLNEFVLCVGHHPARAIDCLYTIACEDSHERYVQAVFERFGITPDAHAGVDPVLRYDHQSKLIYDRLWSRVESCVQPVEDMSSFKQLTWYIHERFDQRVRTNSDDEQIDLEQRVLNVERVWFQLPATRHDEVSFERCFICPGGWTVRDVLRVIERHYHGHLTPNEVDEILRADVSDTFEYIKDNLNPNLLDPCPRRLVMGDSMWFEGFEVIDTDPQRFTVRLILGS